MADLTVSSNVDSLLGAADYAAMRTLLGVPAGSGTSIAGNAGTATALQTARTINGVSFNGTANITVTASANTLTGTALPALDGSALTAINGSQITSGTVADARIASTIARTTLTILTESTTARTLGLTDFGPLAYLSFTNAGAITLTIPTNAVTAIPVGSYISCRRESGAGAITLSFAGVTVNNSALVPTIAANANFGLVKKATDTWDVI